MRWSLAALVLLLASASTQAVDVLTSRNSIARTGVNAEERKLTPANVDSRRFGKLWSLYVDGQVVAQPLYVSSLAVDTRGNPATPLVQGRFNAVLVASMHNTVYLYDADREAAGADGRTVPLWATWLGPPRPSGKDIDMWSTSDPEWGILSTPVIDAAKSTVYVVAWHDDGGGPAGYRYRLHALSLQDGRQIAPPVELQAPGLDARHQKQRPGLLLLNGVLYIGFGGDGSRGLLLAHDAATLARKAVWTVTPNGRDGGLWQAGVAPAADAEGSLYLMTGNGTFDAQTGGANYGDSFVKLHLQGDAFVVQDSFTPCNQAFLNAGDHDLGSSGPVLIPGANLVFGAGKFPHLFLLSTQRMGRHVPTPTPGNAECPNPNALQEVPNAALGHLHGSPLYWQGTAGTWIYLWGENDRLRAYPLRQRRIVAKPVFGQYQPPMGMPGGMLSLSSAGKANGIVWAAVPLDGDANSWRGVQGIVLAMDARDVGKTLWTSEQVPARDHLGLFAKYVPPTIADGKVFVATYGDAEPRRQYGGDATPQQRPARYYVAVYGMLTDTPAAVVNQSRDDVQLLQAAIEPLPALDLARCTAADAGSLDCTAELSRVAAAPSLERVTVPAGYGFAGCQLARVTTVTRAAALATTQGIGFYASDETAGQFSVDHGRRISPGELKAAGNATLKNGQPAQLQQFAGLVNCTLAANVQSELRFKPYIDFVGDPARTTYRNWDVSPDNHMLGGDMTQIDRRAELLR